jgi:hypothetical protein
LLTVAFSPASRGAQRTAAHGGTASVASGGGAHQSASGAFNELRPPVEAPKRMRINLRFATGNFDLIQGKS